MTGVQTCALPISRRRLLERLEQGVGGTLGEPVGILDDDDPVAADGGPVRGELHEVAGLLHLDGEPLGRDDVDVGVRGLQGGAALVALPAPSLRAEQRRGGTHDRLESEEDAFHEAIRQHFLSMASGHPERYLVVDGTQPPEHLHGHVLDRLEAMGLVDP